jgi:hypothetical protein
MEVNEPHNLTPGKSGPKKIAQNRPMTHRQAVDYNQSGVGLPVRVAIRRRWTDPPSVFSERTRSLK